MIDLKPIYTLFREDDGSLPDIYIKNLSRKEFQTIVETCLKYSDSMKKIPAWHLKKDKLIHLDPIEYFKSYFDLKISTYPIHLDKININGTILPQLNMFIYGPAPDNLESIIFDYRMGNDWNDNAILSLFEFLVKLLDIAPNAQINRCEEGYGERPDKDFNLKLMEYISRRIK